MRVNICTVPTDYMTSLKSRLIPKPTFLIHTLVTLSLIHDSLWEQMSCTQRMIHHAVSKVKLHGHAPIFARMKCTASKMVFEMHPILQKMPKSIK